MIGIIAQRLVRRVCTFCREGYTPDDFERRLLQADTHKDIQIYRAVGCPKCEHQGYQGRITVMELLKLDADLDELICHLLELMETPAINPLHPNPTLPQPRFDR